MASDAVLCSAQERWSEPGAELVSTMHGPSASPETHPSAHPEGEQKIKRFLAFSTGASPISSCIAALF